eukprot:744067-Pelagomonas_calceolata.AAC.1
MTSLDMHTNFHGLTKTSFGILMVTGLAQHSWPLERLAPALIYQPQLQIAVKLAHHAPLRRTRTCIPIAAISSSGSSSSSSSSSSSPSPRNLVFKLHKIVGGKVLA